MDNHGQNIKKYFKMVIFQARKRNGIFLTKYNKSKIFG